MWLAHYGGVFGFPFIPFLELGVPISDLNLELLRIFSMGAYSYFFALRVPWLIFFVGEERKSGCPTAHGAVFFLLKLGGALKNIGDHMIYWEPQETVGWGNWEPHEIRRGK